MYKYIKPFYALQIALGISGRSIDISRGLCKLWVCRLAEDLRDAVPSKQPCPQNHKAACPSAFEFTPRETQTDLRVGWGLR